MKRLLHVLLVLLFIGTGIGAQAQLTGVQSIPAGYPSIADAVTALNVQGVGTGGVTFNIAAGHTETVSVPIILTATGTAADPIIFQKDGGGVNPIITRIDGGSLVTSTLGAQGDAIVILEGSDYVTFNGIDISATDSGIEYGYYLRKAGPDNGSKFVTIQNSQVTMNKGTSGFVMGIVASNNDAASALNSAVGITVSSTGGRHENITINGNTVQNVHVGIYLRGFNASTPFDLYDQNFNIGQAGAGNIIQNYGGGSATTSYGIYAIYNNNISLTENNVNNAGVGSPFLSTGYGIFTNTANNANVTIANNTVNVSSGATTSLLTAINNGAGGSGTNNTVQITGNTVTGTYTTATSGAMTAIDNGASASMININNNTVTNSTLSGTGAFTGIDGGGTTGALSGVTIANNTVANNTKTGASGSVFSIRASGSSVAVVNNVIHSNGFSASSGTSSCNVYGYYNAGSPPFETIYENQIYNLYVNGSNTGTSSVMAGILTNTTSSSYKHIYYNTIHNLTAQSGVVSGINTSLGSDVRIYSNRIYSVSNATNVTTTGRVNGILINSGNTYAFNNYIYRLFAPASASTDGVRGISSTSTTTSSSIGLYYNTIYLNASSSAVDFGSSGIFHTTSTTATNGALDMRNNIVVNNSTPSGTGATVAFRRSSATLSNFATADNNCFYAGTPGAYRLIFSDGTNNFETIATYKGFIAPREGLSFSELPPFINVSTIPYNLNISTTTPTQVESGGSAIATPFEISSDFYGNARAAAATDTGAEEFNGVSQDLSPPAISFTPLLNTASTTARTLSATITDATGVPVSGIGLPVLYWSINTSTGPFTAAQGTHVTGDTYEFSFGTGVVPGDVVHYYLAAQDTAPSENVGVSPATGASGPSANPPAASTPPSTPQSYIVTQPPLAGDYLIGIGGAYTTLTAAVNDLNLRGVSASVNFLLTDATYPSETFPIVLNVTSAFLPSASMPVTIRPNTGVTAAISGTSTSGVFVVFGTDHIRIDGSNSGGTDRSLTWENIASANNSYVLGLFHDGTSGSEFITIKNSIIKGGTNSVTNSWGILLNGAGGGYNNTTIENNQILFARTGIQFAGVATNTTNNGIISGNEIGSTNNAESIGNMGISVSQVNGLTISGNLIQNNRVGTNPMGILVSTNSLNTTISGNTIREMVYTGTGGYGGKGIRVNTSSLVSNLDITNNVIYNISGDGWSSLTGDAIIGIQVLGTTGGLNIRYNSINLYGNSDRATATLSAAVYFASTTSNLDVRNNIFSNSIENSLSTSAKAYAIHNAATASAFTAINYNDYFTGGTQGTLGHQSMDIATLANWQAATGQDANSIAVNPQYVSSTVLVPLASSPVLGAGIPIAGITTDFLGAARSATAPSIGAYENAQACPQPAALTATNITATTADLGWTESGTAAVWDIELGLTGFTPIGTPTYSNVTTNPYTVTGLTALTTYDFYVRADCGGGESVWSGPFTFTTACAAQLAGTYTIGAAGDYTTIAAAVNALISCGVSAPVVFNVITGSGPYNEQLMITEVPGASSVNTITFNGNGETVTATTTTSSRSLFLLDGADYITVMNFNLVTQSDTNNFVIQLTNGANFNTVDNCVIDLTSTFSSTSTTNAGIVVSGSLTSATSTTVLGGSNNTFTGNTITGGYYGLTINGESSTNNSLGDIVVGNTIKDFYFYGLYLKSISNASISENDISRPVRSTVSTFNGIYFITSGDNNVVEANLIHDPYLGQGGTSTSGAYAIYHTGADATTGNPNKVVNNLVYNFQSSGNIYALYNSGSNGVNYYHNTVSLDDALATSGITRGFYQTTSAVDIQFKNNIVTITRGGSGTKYCLYFGSTGSVISSDQNVLYMNAPAGTNGIGYLSTGYTTLADWITASGGDAGSTEANPVYTNPATDSYIPTNATVNNIGAAVGVATDITGAARNLSTPDPGAYEFTAVCDAPTALTLDSVTTISTTVSWTASATETGGYTWYVFAAGANPATATPVQTGSVGTGITTVTVSGLSASTAYDFYIRTQCAGGAESNLAGPLVITTSAPPCDAPTALTLSGVTSSAATVSWTASATETGGYTWYVFAAGANPATATPVQTGSVGTGITTVTVSGLSASTAYDFYIRTQCAGGAESNLAGPLVITTSAPPCDAPTALTLSGVTSSAATVSWTASATETGGYTWYVFAAGANPATATPVQTGSVGTGITTITVSGLSASTAYDFYVRTLCSGGAESSLAGPLNFTTATLGTDDNLIQGFTFYPNPATDFITISASVPMERVVIYSLLGQKVTDETIDGTAHRIQVSGLASGVYLLQVTSGSKTGTYRLIKR